MGQAKQRGTFLQRKVEGEARRIAEELRRREEEAAREAALTPAQKEARRKLQMAIGFVTAITPPEVLAAAKFGRALF
jgi:vacuolar-type H+-ATPase subunit E/Vma4